MLTYIHISFFFSKNKQVSGMKNKSILVVKWCINLYSCLQKWKFDFTDNLLRDKKKSESQVYFKCYCYFKFSTKCEGFKAVEHIIELDASATWRVFVYSKINYSSKYTCRARQNGLRKFITFGFICGSHYFKQRFINTIRFDNKELMFSETKHTEFEAFYIVYEN